MEMRGYPVRVYQEDDGSWAAEVPDLPGCVAGADAPAELFEVVSDAIDEWIHSAQVDGLAIPSPTRQSEYSGRFLVRTLASLHEQLAWRADREGVSLNALIQVALTAYLVRAQAPATTNVLHRLPSAFGWEFESAGVKPGIVRVYGFSGAAPAEDDRPPAAITPNQLDVTRSGTPALVQ